LLTGDTMRGSAAVVLAIVSIGAAVMAVPGVAEARFGAVAIADTVADMTVAQPAQYRQRAYRRTYAPRPYTPPQYNTVSPYRYPGSRGALDSCSFC
jgi:hypothetical protein